MADAPESTPKIDSLRAKIAADPKSRHFYPLAEELRKIGQLEESEKVLRAGLEHHATYLSAWISLGRVLKDRGAYEEAVDVLMRGLSLDPENVVAAKLIANVHLAMGDKVEAIKKFKLVHALMPADEEAEEMIDRLNREVNPQDYSGGTPAITDEEIPAAPESLDAAPQPTEQSPLDSTEPPFPTGEEQVDESAHEFPAQEPGPSEPAGERTDPADFDMTNPAPFALGDYPLEEMRDEQSEAPLEGVLGSPPTTPMPAYDPDIETPAPEPAATQEPELADESAPFADAELPSQPAAVAAAPVERSAVSFQAQPEEQQEQDALSEPEPAPAATPEPEAAVEPDSRVEVEPEPEPEVHPQRAPSSEDVWASEELSEEGLPASADTVTMAQILAQQGHTARARDIYEKVLEREPDNEEALAGLASLSAKTEAAPPAASPDRAGRLEAWRRKVAR